MFILADIALTLTQYLSQLLHHVVHLALPSACHLSVRPFLCSSPNPLRLEESTAVGDILSLCFWAAGVSISLCVHPCVCVLVCVHPMQANILIVCSCFFWVYTAGLCVYISMICESDSWGGMFVSMSAAVCWCVCINSAHLFLLKELL